LQQIEHAQILIQPLLTCTKQLFLINHGILSIATISAAFIEIVHFDHSQISSHRLRILRGWCFHGSRTFDIVIRTYQFGYHHVFIHESSGDAEEEHDEMNVASEDAH
jgi:hypothetical protein